MQPEFDGPCRMATMVPFINPNRDGWYISWEEWRNLFGGGFRQWLRYFWTQGEVTREQHHEAKRRAWERDLVCHYWNGKSVHYCSQTGGEPDAAG